MSRSTKRKQHRHQHNYNYKPPRQFALQRLFTGAGLGNNTSVSMRMQQPYSYDDNDLTRPAAYDADLMTLGLPRTNDDVWQQQQRRATESDLDIELDTSTFAAPFSTARPSMKLQDALARYTCQYWWRRICWLFLFLLVIAVIVILCVLVFFQGPHTQTTAWSTQTDVVPPIASFVWASSSPAPQTTRVFIHRPLRQMRAEFAGNEETTRHVTWWDFNNCTRWNVDLFLISSAYCQLERIPTDVCSSYATHPIWSRANVMEITEALSLDEDPIDGGGNMVSQERVVEKIELDVDTLVFRDAVSSRVMRYIRNGRVYPVGQWNPNAISWTQTGLPPDALVIDCQNQPVASSETMIPGAARYWLSATMRGRCPSVTPLQLDDALTAIDRGLGYGNWCDLVFRALPHQPQTKKCVNVTTCDDGGVDRTCHSLMMARHRRLLFPTLPMYSCYVLQQGLRMLSATNNSPKCTGECIVTRTRLQTLLGCLPCDALLTHQVVLPDIQRSYISPTIQNWSRWNMVSLGNNTPQLPFNSSQPFPPDEYITSDF